MSTTRFGFFCFFKQPLLYPSNMSSFKCLMTQLELQNNVPSLICSPSDLTGEEACVETAVL